MDKIYKSFNIIMEMLESRGMDMKKLTSDQIKSFLHQQTNKVGFEIMVDDIRIVYYLTHKFKWSELKKMFEEQSSRTPHLTILVVLDKITQNNMKQLHEMGIELQIFLLNELQFNITKHVLVPKHELISDPEEKKRILEMYSLKSIHQLPIILRHDPMAKWLNLKSGDIVRITRPSQTSGLYVSYRCCV
jgi:DNA-directed RNA polymerase subunit H (RpoH/RPB5)